MGFDLKGNEERPNTWDGSSTCFFSVTVKSKTVWEVYNIKTYVHIISLLSSCHCHVMSKHLIKIPSMKSLVVTEDQRAFKRLN